MSGGGKTQIAVDIASLADGDSIAAYLTDAAGNIATSTLVGGTQQALDVNVAASVLPTGAATETTLASVLAEIQAFDYAEGAAYASGDVGVSMLAVRNDAGTALAGTTGKYAPLTTDANGALWTHVTGTIMASITGDYAEDSAHVSGDMGLFTLGVRNDNQTTSMTSTNGDYGSFSLNAKGAMYTRDIANGANLQQVVTVDDSAAVALPTAALANRNQMFIQMLSAGKLYLGSATVTATGATRGLLLGQGGFVNLNAGPGAAVYGIANAAGKDVVVWEFAD